MDAWANFGIMNATAKFSPTKLSSVANFSYWQKSSYVGQKLNLPDPPAPYVVPSEPRPIQTSSLRAQEEGSESECETDNHSIQCRYCDETITGLLTIMSHIRIHDERRCFRCNRFFADVDHLKSHIACIHLNMQYAEFEKWSKSILSKPAGKKGEVSSKIETKSITTTAVAPVKPKDPNNSDKPKVKEIKPKIQSPRPETEAKSHTQQKTKKPKLTSPTRQQTSDNEDKAPKSPTKAKSHRNNKQPTSDVKKICDSTKTGLKTPPSQSGEVRSSSNGGPAVIPQTVAYSQHSIQESLRKLTYVVDKAIGLDPKAAQRDPQTANSYAIDKVVGLTSPSGYEESSDTCPSLKPVDHRSVPTQESLNDKSTHDAEDETVNENEVDTEKPAADKTDSDDKKQTSNISKQERNEKSVKKKDSTKKRKRSIQQLEYHPTPVSKIKSRRQSQSYGSLEYDPSAPEPYVPEPYVPEKYTRKSTTVEEYIPQPIVKTATSRVSATKATYSDSAKEEADDAVERGAQKSNNPVKQDIRKDTKADKSDAKKSSDIKPLRSPTKNPLNIPLEDTTTRDRHSPKKVRTAEENAQLREKLLAATSLTKPWISGDGTGLSPRPSSSRSSVPDWVVVDEYGDEDYRQRPASLRSSSRNSSIKSPEPFNSSYQSPEPVTRQLRSPVSDRRPVDKPSARAHSLERPRPSGGERSVSVRDDGGGGRYDDRGHSSDTKRGKTVDEHRHRSRCAEIGCHSPRGKIKSDTPKSWLQFDVIPLYL